MDRITADILVLVTMNSETVGYLLDSLISDSLHLGRGTKKDEMKEGNLFGLLGCASKVH